MFKKEGLRVAGGRVGGFMTIMPHCGSILQAGTCQILSLADNPRWSRVWQLMKTTKPNTKYKLKLCLMFRKVVHVWALHVIPPILMPSLGTIFFTLMLLL